MNKPLAIAVVFVAVFQLTVMAGTRAQVKPETQLEREVQKMMDAVGWPRMIENALARGDLQRSAKARLGPMSEQAAACVDRNYTLARVLDRIFAGYLQLYSDPEIVAGITRFYESSGGKMILDKVAERSKQIGAGAAYAESKVTAYDTLTPDERALFTKFAESPSGKAYLELRPNQLRLHQAQLSALTDEVGRQCRQ